MAEPTVFTQDGKVTVFSYGSNSTAQLRARVKNPSLLSFGASAPNFCRVFCLQSVGWGGGGIASLAPCPGKVTLGAMVELSLAEKALLDEYEKAYREEVITIEVKSPSDGGMERRSAIVYIAGPRNAGTFTPPMTVEPSMEYLTAIHFMLREHWDMNGRAIEVNGLQPPLPGSAGDTVVQHSEWMHPGPHGLTLHALCVEINGLKPPKDLWVMPKTIPSVVEKLTAIGCDPQVAASQLLLDHVGGSRLEHLNEKLVQAGKQPFSSDTLAALQSLLCGPMR